MKLPAFTLAMLVILSTSALAQQQDAEGTKDHPMFPNRMANYTRSESSTNFDAVEFNLAAGATKMVTKEGTKSLVRYDFNPESGQSKPSPLQILRNYEAAAKKIGAETQFLSAGEGIAVFKIAKNGSEVWIKLETGGDGNNDFYILTILEVGAMNQEISSTDMLAALGTEGHISLYINFETGKSDIKPESQKLIDQIVEMLQSNPALTISIEGHTDNVGTAPSNQTLSENRAKSVMNAVIAKGIDKGRLVSKGWGQTKPITDNKTEEDRAKNRRVEIVKT
jgi:OmpA-OmpF porin, OOP family